MGTTCVISLGCVAVAAFRDSDEWKHIDELAQLPATLKTLLLPRHVVVPETLCNMIDNLPRLTHLSSVNTGYLPDATKLSTLPVSFMTHATSSLNICPSCPFCSLLVILGRHHFAGGDDAMFVPVSWMWRLILLISAAPRHRGLPCPV